MLSLESVDVIITTKNRLAELEFTLTHLTKVIALNEKQIYIIDDASTDNTFEVVRQRFPEINIEYNTESKGLIHNRNILMSKGSGEFILSLDDDSHIRSREDLKEAIEILDSDKSFGCFCFRPFEQLNEPPLKEDLSEEIVFVKSYIGCGHIIKRHVFEKVGGYYEPFEFYCEENDFCIKAFTMGFYTILKKNLVVHHRIDWSIRALQTKTDLSKGVYGAVWRSSLGFSNHLLLDSGRFPFPLNMYLLFKHLTLRFVKFFVLAGDRKGFMMGLKRYFQLRSDYKAYANKMSIKQAVNYLRLENF